MHHLHPFFFKFSRGEAPDPRLHGGGGIPLTHPTRFGDAPAPTVDPLDPPLNRDMN